MAIVNRITASPQQNLVITDTMLELPVERLVTRTRARVIHAVAALDTDRRVTAW